VGEIGIKYRIRKAIWDGGMIGRVVGISIDPIYVSATLGRGENGEDGVVDLTTCNYQALVGTLDLAGLDANGQLHSPFDVLPGGLYGPFRLRLFFDDPSVIKFIVSKANAPSLTVAGGFKVNTSKREVEW